MAINILCKVIVKLISSIKVIELYYLRAIAM